MLESIARMILSTASKYISIDRIFAVLKIANSSRLCSKLPLPHMVLLVAANCCHDYMNGLMAVLGRC